MPGKQTWNREKHQSASYNPKLSKDNPWVLYVQGWQNYRAITKLIVFLASGGSWAILIIVPDFCNYWRCAHSMSKMWIWNLMSKRVTIRQSEAERTGMSFSCISLVWHSSYDIHMVTLIRFWLMIWAVTKIFIDSVVNFMLRPTCCCFRFPDGTTASLNCLCSCSYMAGTSKSPDVRF